MPVRVNSGQRGKSSERRRRFLSERSSRLPVRMRVALTTKLHSKSRSLGRASLSDRLPFHLPRRFAVLVDSKLTKGTKYLYTHIKQIMESLKRACVLLSE